MISEGRSLLPQCPCIGLYPSLAIFLVTTLFNLLGDSVRSVLDPASGPYAWVVMRTGVMESLFRFDENLNVEKNLVRDYSVSEDGLIWTIELLDKVKFQNGDPMDGEAVKASLERSCALQSRTAQELNIASIGAENRQAAM